MKILVGTNKVFKTSTGKALTTGTQTPKGYSVKINATSEWNYPPDGFSTLSIAVDGVTKWTSTWSSKAQTVNQDLGTGSMVTLSGLANEVVYTIGGRQYTNSVDGNSDGVAIPLTGDFVLTSFEAYCLTGDMLITLADGSQKRIDQLTLDDKVLSYNPDTMQLEADEVTYTDSAENKKHTEYDVWTFSDGTIVKTVHRHRLYNVERQAMVYMDEWKMGEHAINSNGEYIELIDHENIKEEVRHYTIFTKSQNYFVNGLLSGNRHTKEMHL